jgi:Transglycosylase SLT domain
MAQARAGSPPLQRTRSRRGSTPFRRALRRHSRKIQSAWRRATWRVRLIVVAVLLLALWAPINLAYQVTHKPSEMLAPLSSLLIKTPDKTWQSYAPLFRRYATPNVAPELLAALAQAESAGDPVATTYWHWRFSLNPLAIYRPASSSVGMYQMTDAAYAEARRFCVSHHRVAEDHADSDTPACGQDGAYWRIMPSDAIQLTATYLDRKLAALLAKRHPAPVTQQQKDNLAAVIHLCGPGPAASYLRRGFHLAPGERCGDQDIAAYVGRVSNFEREFRQLAHAEAS